MKGFKGASLRLILPSQALLGAMLSTWCSSVRSEMEPFAQSTERLLSAPRAELPLTVYLGGKPRLAKTASLANVGCGPNLCN